MARAIMSAENQLERIKNLATQLKGHEAVDLSKLAMKPDNKSWSVIEIIEHLVISAEVYRKKLDAAVVKAIDTPNERNEFTSSAIPSYLIKSFPPKDGVIKSKMKTFKKFKPSQNKPSLLSKDKIFTSFYDSLNHLEEVILLYKKKDVTQHKFNSAIGFLVRFNIVEAVEFVICHNERHLRQLENTLKKLS